MGRCAGDHRAGRGRDRRHDDADAQSLARRKNHRDLGTAAPALARPEERGAAADDARGAVASRSRSASPAGLLAMLAQIVTAALMMAYALTGFAVLHTLTLALKSRALWLGLHLRHRRGVRLARAGDGGARPCRRHFRISPALSAQASRRPCPHPEFHPSTQTQSLITSKENEYGSHFAGTRRQARPDGRSRPRQGRICPQLSAQARQGAARHRRQPRQVRRHEGRARSPQPQGQGRGDQGRREDRRPQRRSCCVRPRRPASCSDR